MPASLTDYNRGIYNCPNLTTITVASGNAHFSVEGGNRLLYTADDGTKTLYAWPTAPAETTVPDGINTLKGTFWGNQTLTTVTLPESVTCIAQSAFAACPVLQTINLEHVTTIEKEGFYGDTSLKSATLSAHIESLEHRAFRDCTALETVCIAAENPPTLYSPSSKTTPFQGCTALTRIEVPAASVAAYQAAEGWSTLADKIVGYE